MVSSHLALPVAAVFLFVGTYLFHRSTPSREVLPCRASPQKRVCEQRSACWRQLLAARYLDRMDRIAGRLQEEASELDDARKFDGSHELASESEESEEEDEECNA